MNIILGFHDHASITAFEIILMRRQFVARGHRSSKATGSECWSDVFNSVLKQGMTRLRELSSADLSLCATGVLRDLLSVEDLLQWHGAAGLFKKRSYRCLPGTAVPLVNVLLDRLISAAAGECALDAAGIEGIGAAGAWLLNREVPWVDLSDVTHLDEEYFSLHSRDYIESGDTPKAIAFSPETLFGTFCLLAIASELSHGAFHRIRGRALKYLRGSNLLLPMRIAVARSVPMTSAKLAKLVARCGFDSAQSDLITRWATGQIALTNVGAGIQIPLLTEAELDDEITGDEWLGEASVE